MTETSTSAPAPLIRGAGIGLRIPHIQTILRKRPRVPWFEVLADNHFAPGGHIPAQLAAVREHYPITLHSVGLSLGSTDPLNTQYLAELRRLADGYEAAWVSEHCCFVSAGGHHVHDLLPLPYTEEAVIHMASKIRAAQDFLGRRLLIENVSSYVNFTHSTMSEAEFLAELVARADCGLLLDLNNLYVSQINLAQDAERCIDALPLNAVGEIHLGGYDDYDSHLVDAHNHAVAAPVWRLYERLLDRTGPIPTLIEWDNDLPEFEILLHEAEHAGTLLSACVEEELTHAAG